MKARWECPDHTAKGSMPCCGKAELVASGTEPPTPGQTPAKYRGIWYCCTRPKGHERKSTRSYVGRQVSLEGMDDPAPKKEPIADAEIEEAVARFLHRRRERAAASYER